MAAPRKAAGTRKTAARRKPTAAQVERRAAEAAAAEAASKEVNLEAVSMTVQRLPDLPVLVSEVETHVSSNGGVHVSVRNYREG
jgi:hypothetical protein